MSDYPQREKHFAHRFCRLVMKSCVATEHGQDVALLLIGIAMTEDSRRYRGAVTYFNEQLVPVLGFANVKALQRAREAAVEAGWLHYEPGARRRPARYWVTIPSEFADDDGGEMGREEDELKTDSRQKTTRHLSTECPQSVHSSSTVCPTIVPSPIPCPTYNQPNKADEPKTFLRTWTIPSVAAKNPRIVQAIDKWQAYIAAKDGRPWDDIRLDQTLANKLSEKWTADRLVASIEKSIEWGARTWRDPDNDFDKRPKSANHEPKQVDYKPLEPATREPTR